MVVCRQRARPVLQWRRITRLRQPAAGLARARGPGAGLAHARLDGPTQACAARLFALSIIESVLLHIRASHRIAQIPALICGLQRQRVGEALRRGHWTPTMGVPENKGAGQPRLALWAVLVGWCPTRPQSRGCWPGHAARRRRLQKFLILVSRGLGAGLAESMRTVSWPSLMLASQGPTRVPIAAQRTQAPVMTSKAACPRPPRA